MRNSFINSYNYKEIKVSDPEFPSRLLNDEYISLFAMGNFDILNEVNTIAVVGTRNASYDGKYISYNIAKQAARNNFVVVSGLARGIDKAAHEGCVDEKSPTIAVLPTGIMDKIYPFEHTELAGKILDTGGCLVSLTKENKKFRKASFFERNVIQVKLSSIVFIVETASKGGTIHTFNIAKKNSETTSIACMEFPPNVIHKTNSGGNDIILEHPSVIPFSTASEVEYILKNIHEGKVTSNFE